MHIWQQELALTAEAHGQTEMMYSLQTSFFVVLCVCLKSTGAGPNPAIRWPQIRISLEYNSGPDHNTINSPFDCCVLPIYQVCLLPLALPLVDQMSLCEPPCAPLTALSTVLGLLLPRPNPEAHHPRQHLGDQGHPPWRLHSYAPCVLACR